VQYRACFPQVDPRSSANAVKGANRHDDYFQKMREFFLLVHSTMAAYASEGKGS
jgi:hypothetical protein